VRSAGHRPRLFLIIPALLVCAFILLKNAWVGDDAYITLRTIDNFVNGYGLTYNIDERVQAFTHPLWLIVITLVYAVTREPYFTVLALSAFFSMAAVGIYAFKIARSYLAAIVGTIALTLSVAFVDYSTSGLENPLTLFLFAVFLYVYFEYRFTLRSLLFLSLIGGLAACTRMDSVLLYSPMLVWVFWKLRGMRAVSMVVLGFVPFIAWEVFSLIYYGFPFPNTAYSKLSTGLESSVLVPQGLYYLYTSVKMDPLTILLIVSAIVLPFIRRDRHAIPAAIGLVLLLTYVVKIGGSFMAGRYLAAPMLGAVILLSRYVRSAPKGVVIGAAAAILAAGLATPYSPVYTHSGDMNDRDQAFLDYDIVDERAYYHATNGLLNYFDHDGPWPSHPKAQKGRLLRADGNPYSIIGTGMIGMIGYYGGPNFYVSDGYGLVDPLIARLPVRKDREYKPGHYRRDYPPGYYRMLNEGWGRIIDSNLAIYNEVLRYITGGDVLDGRRIWEVVKFNAGAYDHLLDAYLTPHVVSVDLDYFGRPKREGSIWYGLQNLIFFEPGIEVDLGQVYQSPYLEISRGQDDDLELTYLLRGVNVTRQIIPPKAIPKGDLAVSRVNVPREAVERGYDMLKIVPISGDGKYAIGHIRLLNERR